MLTVWKAGLMQAADEAVLGGSQAALASFVPPLGLLIEEAPPGPVIAGWLLGPPLQMGRREGVISMGGLGNRLEMVGNVIETVLGIAVGLVLFTGLAMRMAQGFAAPRTWFHRHTPKPRSGGSHAAVLRIGAIAVAASLAVPSLAAAEGWWWGSPINPGFDRSTVIEVYGTARHVTIAEQSGPGMLTLECAHESFTVMLAPGWYLAQVRADIRDGDVLTVEGSKMMDRKGKLHVVAARVINERTGAVLELRDDTGRPRWMGGRSPGRMMR